MSVIIRLQNLPWSANALDIRKFFSGLSIPEGGVHIVGGELGDAFIAFSTDEDARQAFNLNGGKIKEIQIKLMLSSRTEMQKVIEAARNPLVAFMQNTQSTPSLSSIIPPAVPSAIPELKKDDSKEIDKRDRRRSRSRSRDRNERSRDRDRERERDRRDKRRRDRSRTRSRDRRDRRRRDRSHSRDRRSKDRDRHIKERRHSDDKTASSTNSSNGNGAKESNKSIIWDDPVRTQVPPFQQSQALITSFMPNNLEEARRNLNALSPSPLLMNNRNGFPNQKDNFIQNRVNDDWNTGSSIRQTDVRSNYGLRQGIPNSDQFNLNPGRRPPGNQQFGDNQRKGFNRNLGRPDGRVSRFDMTGERPALLDSKIDRPYNIDRLSSEKATNCCVMLKPFYGGYGEIRRYFQGLFIHNTGIKFVNDEHGKRTGIVYIRFASPEGKQEALLRTGGLLKQTTVEVVHLEDSMFDNTMDKYQPDTPKPQQEYKPDYSFKQKPSPPPVFSRSPPPSVFSCIAISDLPHFTKEQDMLKIFSDYSLLSIWLVNKQRFITAYIKFANPDEAKTAITEKSKHLFKGKCLNIRACSDSEYSYVTNEDTDNKDRDAENKSFINTDCVSLSGLPLKTTDRDVSDFFSDVAIVPNKIHLINSNLGFTGQAYCEFSSPADAEVALEKDGLPLGSGIVTVKAIQRLEMESSLGITARNTNQTRPMFPRNYGPPHSRPNMMGHRPPMRRFTPTSINLGEMTPTEGCTILMENVPYKAGLDEILDFFEGFEIIPDNVLRRYNENGSPSGEAKVIFNSPEDAYQACEERNHCKIRERIIYLTQC